MKRIKELYNDLNVILTEAEGENQLSKEENEMYSDMANLKISIEDACTNKLTNRDNLRKAVAIMNLFENYLYENDIKIKNKEKEDDNSAIIYGEDYYSLEDEILKII